MTQREAIALTETKHHVEKAHAHMCALFTALNGAGDTPVPASQVLLLLEPVQSMLDKATEE